MPFDTPSVPRGMAPPRSGPVGGGFGRGYLKTAMLMAFLVAILNVETGVAYIACGHHASERYGAPAVAAHVAGQLGIEHHFIDIPNPA